MNTVTAANFSTTAMIADKTTPDTTIDTTTHETTRSDGIEDMVQNAERAQV
jgi:hypothetical protein